MESEEQINIPFQYRRKLITPTLSDTDSDSNIIIETGEMILTISGTVSVDQL